MRKTIFWVYTLLACLFTACQDTSKLSVSDLQCEYLDAPLAIDNTSPPICPVMVPPLYL